MNREQSTYWSAYVRLLRGDMSQTDFADRYLGAKSQQGKVSRWEKGESPPDRAADVAFLARETGHNVLEAFVAAGMLELEEAIVGMEPENLDVLEQIGAYDPAAGSGAFVRAAMERLRVNDAGEGVRPDVILSDAEVVIELKTAESALADEPLERAAEAAIADVAARNEDREKERR